MMPQYPKVLYPTICDVSLGVNGYEDTVVDVIQQNFELNPNYAEVYILHSSVGEQDFLHDPDIRNDHGLPTYKSWIFDGTEDEQTVGYKYIQMYPYDKPILQEGDYVIYDYYENGIKSTFLCVALDSNNSYEQIGKIRLCTNEIRFINDDGLLIRVPCVFDNKINSEKNISLYNMKFINGITTIYTQVNDDSKQLKPNQRLLFGAPGNWTAFKVVSVGVNNFMNTVYWDNDSARVLEITMEAAYVNEDMDDIVNGVADANVFHLYLPSKNINLIVGDKIVSKYTLVKNGTSQSDKPVIWESNNQSVASVDEYGNIYAIEDGNCVITVKMRDNEYISAFMDVSVSKSREPSYSVVVSPYNGNEFGILQGDEQIFSCFLMLNGEQLQDTFDFEIKTDANDRCYEFEIVDKNHFKIKNIRMSTYPLFIKCSNGSYEYNTKIVLKGAW